MKAWPKVKAAFGVAFINKYKIMMMIESVGKG